MENKIIRKPGRPKIFTEEELEELRDLYEYELSCLEEIGLILIENITVNSDSYDEVRDLIRVLRKYYQTQLDEIKPLLKN